MANDKHNDAHAGHDHGGHGHAHAPTTFNRAFAIGVTLNVIFVVTKRFAGSSIPSPLSQPPSCGSLPLVS